MRASASETRRGNERDRDNEVPGGRATDGETPRQAREKERERGRSRERRHGRERDGATSRPRCGSAPDGGTRQRRASIGALAVTPTMMLSLSPNGASLSRSPAFGATAAGTLSSPASLSDWCTLRVSERFSCVRGLVRIVSGEAERKRRRTEKGGRGGRGGKKKKKKQE